MRVALGRLSIALLALAGVGGAPRAAHSRSRMPRLKRPRSRPTRRPDVAGRARALEARDVQPSAASPSRRRRSRARACRAAIHAKPCHRHHDRSEIESSMPNSRSARGQREAGGVRGETVAWHRRGRRLLDARRSLFPSSEPQPTIRPRSPDRGRCAAGAGASASGSIVSVSSRAMKRAAAVNRRSRRAWCCSCSSLPARSFRGRRRKPRRVAANCDTPPSGSRRLQPVVHDRIGDPRLELEPGRHHDDRLRRSDLHDRGPGGPFLLPSSGRTRTYQKDLDRHRHARRRRS